jgi:arsenite methyltransferase
MNMRDDCLTGEQALKIQQGIKAKYRAVSEDPGGAFTYPIGRDSALAFGYEPRWVDSIPAHLVERFVGVGNPFSLYRPRDGERVLDVGCGCGFDSFVASTLVGPQGHVVGVDLTPEMVAIARTASAIWRIQNIQFTEGSVEALPFDDGSFDLVISNAVLNLVPDKDAAFRQLFRLLRPGGQFVAADLLLDETLPKEVLAEQDAWSN